MSQQEFTEREGRKDEELLKRNVRTKLTSADKEWTL